KVDESVESAFEVLRKRIDKFGVAQPNIQRRGQSGRILVELPVARDVDRISNLLQSTDHLELWETYRIDELGQFLMSANEALKSTETAVVTEESTTVATDTIGSLLTDTAKDSTAAAKNPLFDKFIGQGGGPILGVVAPKDTA